MILQQLIQKNKRLLRKALKSQTKNARLGLNKKMQSNLLQTNKLSVDTFNLKSFLLEHNNQIIPISSKEDSYFINGRKYQFMREMSNKIIKQQIYNTKLHKTHGASHQKWAKPRIIQKQKRLIQTAQDFIKLKGKNLDKQIENLPNSFSLKTSRMIKRIRSTSIKYEVNQRQNCIHSREKYLTQEKSMRNNRSRSRSFSANLKGLLAGPQNNNSHNNIQDIKFQVEKIVVNNTQKSTKQEGIPTRINIFQEYRKAKMKYEKEQPYTPWKKLGQRKQIDLEELYELAAT